MKTPTLKEVKEKYKNVKEVRCLLHKESRLINYKVEFLNESREWVKGNYWLGNKEFNVLVYRDGEYAEIISYKEEIEPTTEVRNSVLLQLADNNSYSEEILKKECPKLFKLKPNNWYKTTDNENCLLFATEIINSNNANGYGFGRNGNWIEQTFNYEIGLRDTRLATPQEVETALIQEAKKRGFGKKGVTFTDIFGEELTSDIDGFDFWNLRQRNIMVSEENKFNISVCKNKGVIFSNGTWATIIETPTDIITIVEKYGKDKIQEYLNNSK